jgi:hypothetical protein
MFSPFLFRTQAILQRTAKLTVTPEANRVILILPIHSLPAEPTVSFNRSSQNETQYHFLLPCSAEICIFVVE